MNFLSLRIHRALLAELAVAFALSLVTFNFILVTDRVISLTKVFSSVGASLGDMVSIVMLLQPQITLYTIPLAFLIAVLITYGRMGADSELVILRTSGMSFAAIARPAFVLGVGCFTLALLISFVLGPMGAAELRRKISGIIAERAPLAIEAGIFNTSFEDFVIFVEKKAPTGELGGVFIYDGRKAESPSVLMANSGSVSTAGGYTLTLDLRDGRIHMNRPDGSVEIKFGRYLLSLPIAIEGPAKSFKELTPQGLVAAAAGTEGGERLFILLELYRRLTLPALCLVLMLLGPPLALLAGKSGRLGGFTLGIAVFAAYYAMLVYTEGLARTAKLPLAAGALAPILVLGVFSGWMFMRAEKR